MAWIGEVDRHAAPEARCLRNEGHVELLDSLIKGPQAAIVEIALGRASRLDEDGAQSELVAALEFLHRVVQHVADVDAGYSDEASPVLALKLRHIIIRGGAGALRSSADFENPRLPGYRYCGCNPVLSDLL